MRLDNLDRLHPSAEARTPGFYEAGPRRECLVEEETFENDAAKRR
jgi:hypothetical protein